MVGVGVAAIGSNTYTNHAATTEDYDLQRDPQQNRYLLNRSKTIYTKFSNALDRITKAEPGDIHGFIDYLQERLDERLESGSPPDAPALLDVLNSENM